MERRDLWDVSVDGSPYTVVRAYPNFDPNPGDPGRQCCLTQNVVVAVVVGGGVGGVGSVGGGGVVGGGCVVVGVSSFTGVFRPRISPRARALRCTRGESGRLTPRRPVLVQARAKSSAWACAYMAEV